MTERSIRMAYSILGFFFFVMCLVAIFSLKDITYTTRQDAGCSVVETFGHQWVEDASYPLGGYDLFAFDLQNVETMPTEINFYCVHQNVEVYLGDELVYEQYPAEDNLYGHTPGNNWVGLYLSPIDVEKTLCIRLVPNYKSSIGRIPVFYLGGKWSVFQVIARAELFPFLLAAFSVVIGLLYLVIAVYGWKYGATGKELVDLGVFALVLGIWKIMDLKVTSLLFPNQIATAVICLVALFYVPIPYALFIRSVYKQNRDRIYYALCLIDAAFLAFVLVMQLLGIMDFRELLTDNHIIMLLMAAVSLVLAVIDVARNGWSKRIKSALLIIVVCAAGLVIDMVLYYGGRGRMTSGWAMMGFVLYLIVLGTSLFRDMVVFLEKGKNAAELEELATVDIMTGMKSRNAYMKRLSEIPKRGALIHIIMFDLNNLKYYNDTYGHAAGDQYLMSSAADILKYFGDFAECYRIGGDEFCVIAEDVAASKCHDAMISLKKKGEVDNLTRKGEFPFYIAMGSAVYMPEEDYDLHGTVRRADRAMYRDKIASKEVGNAAGKI